MHSIKRNLSDPLHIKLKKVVFKFLLWDLIDIFSMSFNSEGRELNKLAALYGRKLGFNFLGLKPLIHLFQSELMKIIKLNFRGGKM